MRHSAHGSTGNNKAAIGRARAEADEVRRLTSGRELEADRMRAEAETPARKAFLDGKAIPALEKAALPG